jgi:dihydroneopterin aldolase
MDIPLIDLDAFRDLQDTAGADFVGELVETFAERLALDCLLDARVRGVTVRIEKPGALEAAAAAGCELTYRR